MARWAVNGAAGRGLDVDSACAAQNGVDELAGLEVTEYGFFPVKQLDRHRRYLV
jgi:hypothetical protein